MSQETNDTALGGAFGGEGEGLVQTNPEVEASQDPTITKIVTEDNSLGGTFGSDESPLAQSLSGEAATAAGEAQASEEAAQISATNAANSASAAATSATNASTSETNAATSATDASLSETNAVTSAYTATTKANEASTSATNASTSATNAATSATNAATSETNAATSATNASNSDASSLLNAQEAQSSASQASTSASNAAGSATLAGTHKDAAEDAQGASETARDQAQTYATNSQTSATQSEASATAAATSASEASDSETNAATSETNASTSATNASNSATASANSATQAANSATQAATSATNAATSATNAFTSETNAATSATNSSDSATASATSASEASTSASNALTSEGNASDSATASATSATNAATSATNASTSEGNAATSATNAATSETNAATSATNAATSATNAATSATESSDSAGDSSVSATQSATSATNAATSATNAATSETNAATSESNAAASASEASVSEGNAEASANNASTSATNAANSATAASNSASAAATSASNAASSASAASSSAANASVSETNAANLLDQFEDIYLGSKTSDPTLDNDGDTLQVGSLYFNSTTNDLKIWTGSVWTQVLVDAELQTIVDDAIADLIDSAPTALNTLNELAAALGDDPNFSATISNQIGTLQNDVATLGNIKYEEGDDISVSSVTLEGAATGVGLISWDATNETASMTMGNGVTQQIGEELYYPKRTRNMTGFTIPNGTPVMLVGGVGEDSYIAPAIADGSIPHEYYAGLTTEAIADGDYGRVLFFGSINDIDTSSYTKGDLLYVSDTTHGAFTTTPPEAPSHAILSAIVTKVGTTDGRLFVRVHTNPEAGEITFDNATSGLVSSSVQGAIDELQSNKASVDLLSSNITLFPTTATSPDVTNHNRLVTSKADSDYDTTAQNVATGTVTTSETLVGQLTSDAGLVEGSIAGITVTLIGNIEKLTGNNNQGAHFYFKIYRRESDGTEYLMGESFHTPTLFETDGYEQFSASVYLSNSGMSNFADTDRFVLRFYGIAEGGDCSYQFQFGGEAPVRGIVPVPVSVIPSSSAEDTPTSTTNFNGILSGTNSNVQSALDTLDDHGHAISGITGLDSALQNKVDVTGYNNTNWDTAYGWGDHDGLYLPIDAVTLPDQTGHSGQFLTTNGTTADWATVDTSLGDTAYGWGDHSTEGYLTSFTETDPTVPSHVKSITTTNISNWNTAYGWGDHSTEGYLTSIPSEYLTQTEGDARYVLGSGGYNNTNWDTAYSWGNHATAGYLTSETNDYVDSVSFSTTNGVLTLGRTGALADLTVDLDGRYSTSDTNTTDWYVANSVGGNQFKVDANENVRFEGSGATTVSFDPGTNKVIISSVDTNTNTWRPINDTPVDGATTTSISSNWAFDNVKTAVPANAVFTDTVYSHPTYAGDDINLDTGALSGATVISDLDFNVTTDGLGHVTDANATYSTRNLTAANIGAAPASHNHSGVYLPISGKAADSELLDGVDITRIVHGNGVNRTDGGDPNTLRPSGFYENYQGNSPTSTWYNYINMRHTNAGNGHGHQIAGSFYSAGDIYNRSYSGSGTFTGWARLWNTANDGSGSGLDADLLDGNHASAFATSGHGHTGLSSNGWGGITSSTSSGYIDFGPANTSHAHIYTDRPNFYFNKMIQVLGGTNINQSDVRSDIFYDKNNTGWYLDPSSTSNINSLVATGHIYGRSSNAQYSNLYRFGGIYFTWDSDNYGTNAEHSIRSTDGDSYGDHITLNSFGNVRINFDSNNNGTNYFYIGSGTTGTGNVRYTLDESGNGTTTGSSRAPIFYDSNNTGYYGNFADSNNSLRVAGNIKSIGNYGRGVVGVYSASRLQHLWSMGEAYLLAANGTTSGNMYGIAWSHPNAGTIGGANNLASHGMLILENGVFKGAWGGGRLVTTNDIRGTLFYDYNNTGYYSNPSSTSNFNTLNVAGGNLVNTASKSTSGWWKCAKTGVIMQWARIYVSANSTAYWTFPTAFPSACRSISANQESSNAGIGDNSQFYGITSSGATLRNGWNSSATYFNVFAIGY